MNLHQINNQATTQQQDQVKNYLEDRFHDHYEFEMQYGILMERMLGPDPIPWYPVNMDYWLDGITRPF